MNAAVNSGFDVKA